jgi:pimeloyl-ACP methyl ester carboxylesterase
VYFGMDMNRLSPFRVIPLVVLLVVGCADQPVVDPGPAQPVRHTVIVDGHPIAVWSKRPPVPTGAILLVHGRTWSALPDFDLQVPGEEISFMDDLVRAGFATYAVDLRGYGETPRDSTGWLSPDRAAADLAAVLEWTHRDAEIVPSLFGWSMGSLVAHLTAQNNPELMLSVTLFGYPYSVDVRIPESEDPAEPPRRTNTAAAAASDFIIPGSISDLAVQTYVQVSLAADPTRVDWSRMHEFNVLNPELVTVPTLLIHGEFDPLAPIEAQKEVFARLGTSDKQWTIVPGGDHAALLETPRGYMLEAVVDFVSRSR